MGVSPVTGQRAYGFGSGMTYCKNRRLVGAHCGPEGNEFEPLHEPDEPQPDTCTCVGFHTKC